MLTEIVCFIQEMQAKRLKSLLLEEVRIKDINIWDMFGHPFKIFVR